MIPKSIQNPFQYRSGQIITCFFETSSPNNTNDSIKGSIGPNPMKENETKNAGEIHSLGFSLSV